MWRGLDADVRRELASIREMVSRQHQTPTKEWPLVFVEEQESLLVVREWPGGGLTAYTMPTARPRESRS
jgi:hypothetical protein